MQSVRKEISDSTILSLIAEDNQQGWQYLYDKFAAVIYGTICSLTADKTVANEILIKLFVELKQKKRLPKINSSLCVFIVRYTNTATREQLKMRGITCPTIPVLGNSLIATFCQQFISIKEVTAELKIREHELKTNLHKEFLIMSSQIEQSKASLQQKELKEYPLTDR